MELDPNFEFARAQYENDLDLQNEMVYKRLSEVIDKMAREEELFVNGVPRKKMTFEEWAEDSQMLYRSVENKSDLEYYLKECWKAAQDNK